jgi:hypothetical protein
MDIADILSTVRAMRAIYLYLHHDNPNSFISTAGRRDEDALDEVWVHLINRLSRDVDDRCERKRLAEEAAEKKRKAARYVAARVDALKKGPTALSKEELERFNDVFYPK